MQEREWLDTLFVIYSFVRAILVCVTVLFAAQRDEHSVFFDDSNASWEPRRTKFARAVGKGAICISAATIHVMPTQPGFPVETFALVMTLLSAAKASDLKSRGRRVRHVAANIVCMRCDVNVFSTRQHTHRRHTWNLSTKKNQRRCRTTDHKSFTAHGMVVELEMMDRPKFRCAKDLSVSHAIPRITICDASTSCDSTRSASPCRCACALP